MTFLAGVRPARSPGSDNNMKFTLEPNEITKTLPGRQVEIFDFPDGRLQIRAKAITLTWWHHEGALSPNSQLTAETWPRPDRRRCGLWVPRSAGPG